MRTSADTPTVAVVGGSIAGCAAAMAARRAGYDVTVLERSGGTLHERGFGVTLSTAVHAELLEAGYLTPDAPTVPLPHRLWLTREADGDGWRELWRQSPDFVTCNWGLLWKSLRANVSDDTYQPRSIVTSVRTDDEGRAVVSVEGRPDSTYDLVIGADGHRSAVRQQVEPGSAPAYVGYIAFRGVTPVRALAHDPELVELLSHHLLSVMYDGGHLIVYLIPGADGERRVNWVMYAEPPEGAAVAAFATSPDLDLVAWGRRLAVERLPAQIEQIIAATREIGVQPVVDLTLAASATAPFLLVGDASSVTRPHTGSGALKALQDALTLERAMTSAATLEGAVKAYDAERNPAGNQIVELGRRIGRDHVEQTPDWPSMDADAVAQHAAATWSGQDHYLLPAND